MNIKSKEIIVINGQRKQREKKTANEDLQKRRGWWIRKGEGTITPSHLLHSLVVASTQSLILYWAKLYAPKKVIIMLGSTIHPANVIKTVCDFSYSLSSLLPRSLPFPPFPPFLDLSDSISFDNYISLFNFMLLFNPLHTD